MTMKTAKEYYTDVFEGIRLSVCGLFGLLASLILLFVSAVRYMAGRRNRHKENANAEDRDGEHPEEED